MVTTDIKKVIETDLQLRHSGKPLYDLADLDSNLPWANEDVGEETRYFNLRADDNEDFDILTYKETFLDEVYKHFFAILPLELRKHVVIAGGAIFNSAYGRRFEISDIDIFIHGIESEAALELVNKIGQIYINIYNPIHVTRSKSALTFSNLEVETPEGQIYKRVAGFCDRIQIIFRIYESVAQILYGFDMQCAALAMIPTNSEKGYKIVATNLAVYSHKTGRLPIDTTRRSLTFEKRIRKYMNRGVTFVFPFIDPVKVATAFATTSLYFRRFGRIIPGVVLPPELAAKKQARIRLAGCILNLKKRIGNTSYTGSLTKIKTVYNKVSKNYPYLLSKTLLEYNLGVIRSAIESGSNEQPDLYFPLERVRGKFDLLSPIDLRKSFVGKIAKHYIRTSRNVQVIPAKDIRLEKAMIKQIKFPLLFEARFRTIDPASQWSSSFDPINESPQDWYGSSLYVSDIPDQQIPYTYTYSQLQNTPIQGYGGNPSYVEIFSRAKPNEIPELPVAPYSSLEAIKSAYIAIVLKNSLRLDNRLTLDDYRKIIIELMSVTKRSVDLKDIVQATKISKNDIEISNFARAMPVVNFTALPEITYFCELLPKILGSYRAKKHFAELRKQIVKQSIFRWQDMCKVTSSVPIEEIKIQATYFGVANDLIENPKTTRRQLCKALAEKTDEFMSKYTAPCANFDDYDQILYKQMSETPAFMIWTKIGANNQKYCYNILDMYEIVKNNIKRDPKGNTLTPEDISDIKDRVSFLTLVLSSTDRDTEDSFVEKMRDMLIYERPETPQSIVGKIAVILPYNPLNSDVLSRLEIRYIRSILRNAYQYVARDVENLSNERLPLLQTMLSFAEGTSLQANALAEAMRDFAAENGDIVEEILVEIDRENRRRYNNQQ